LSKEKEKLKLDRREAKKLRNKIVGAGNTMDSYGDKFMSMKGSLGSRGTTRPQMPSSVSRTSGGSSSLIVDNSLFQKTRFIFLKIKTKNNCKITKRTHGRFLRIRTQK
jgi:hypothetical protein